MLVNVLHNRPSDGNAVVCRGSPPQLVKKHQAAWREIVQDVGSFIHLYHKGRFADGNIITGPHAGKYLVHQSDMCTLCGYETAYLRQQRYQCRLPQQCRLTRHVRTSDDNNLLRTAVQHHIVGYVLLSYRQLFLNHRMASLTNIQHIIIFNDRADIAVLTRYVGKRKQTVQTSNLGCIDLNVRYELVQGLHQFRIELSLQYQYFVFGSQYFLFILLELLGDISFRICQGLLAYPLLRHFIFMRISHLDVITEYIVVTDLQAGDFRQFTLPLLYLQQVIFA